MEQYSFLEKYEAKLREQKSKNSSPILRLVRFLTGEMTDPADPEWDDDEIQVIRKKYAAVQTNEYSRSLEIYKLYREKVTHEDALVNFRTSWFMGLQAILFPTYILALRFVDIEQAPIVPRSIAVVGLVSSVTSFLSVRAAVEAINKTTQKWTHPYIDRPNGRFVEMPVRDLVDPLAILPAIKGGGASTGIAFRGNVSSIVLPIVVMTFWSMTLILGPPISVAVSPQNSSIVEIPTDETSNEP